MKYDYLVVGAGITGASFARTMTDAGKRCLVIDSRSHIAGNCYSYMQNGIEIHKYGPHIFHTNSEKVWKFVNRFAKFNSYRHRVFAMAESQLVSLPINMFTFEDVFGSRTANEARIAVERDIVPQETTDTVESWCLANIGKTLYELLVKGYTEKQWGRKASQLPASYIKRLPMRFEYDNRYFSDRYQGIPFDGYTQMISKMLDGIEVRCNVDFFTHRHLEQQATKVFYTGPIDRLVDGEPLAYRAISIELVELPTTSALGCAQVNYPGNESWTRITEFKHFMTQTSVIPYTIIGIERPEEYNGTNERSYPVTDTENSERAARYIAQAEAQGYLVAGRLGSFQYLDMHQAIAQGITRAEKELYAAQ